MHIIRIVATVLIAMTLPLTTLAAVGGGGTNTTTYTTSTKDHHGHDQYSGEPAGGYLCGGTHRPDAGRGDPV